MGAGIGGQGLRAHNSQSGLLSNERGQGRHSSNTAPSMGGVLKLVPPRPNVKSALRQRYNTLKAAVVPREAALLRDITYRLKLKDM
jgi:hypothetical protein